MGNQTTRRASRTPSVASLWPSLTLNHLIPRNLYLVSYHLRSWQSVWFMRLFELLCWSFCDPASTTWIAGKVIQASMLNAVADILTLCTHQNAGVLTLLWLYNYSVDQSKAQKVARRNKCLNNIFAIRSFFCPTFSKKKKDNFSFHVALKWFFSIWHWLIVNIGTCKYTRISLS